MSLTAILRRIDKVDQKHRDIVQRYSSACKLCPRQEELEREEQEDQRIFGYSSSQILGLYKQKAGVSFEETRPCTANLEQGSPALKLKREFRNCLNEGRAKSAVKPVFKYQQQYNFLFKEDIFDENHEKLMVSVQPCQQKRKAEKRLSKNFKSSEIPFSVKQQHMRSMRDEKARFIEGFGRTLELMQNRDRQHVAAKRRNDNMTYEKKTDTPKPIVQPPAAEFEDVFRLTKANFLQGSKRLKISFISSQQHVRGLGLFLNQAEKPQFIKLDQANKQPLPFQLLFDELLPLLPSKFCLTCISVPSLLSLKLHLVKINDDLLVEQTKEKIDLNFLRESLLKEQGFVHLYFHSKEDLFYELFLMKKGLVYGKCVENQITLLSYYLKRFMLFDGKNSIKAAHESTELMLKNNVDIPDDFFSFVETFSEKIVHFYDKERRYLTLCPKNIVLGGLKAIQAFKREKGQGLKVKLRQGTNKKFKQFNYNWAYFYICLFLSINLLISIGASNSFATSCSPPSATVSFCSPPLPSSSAPSSASMNPFPSYQASPTTTRLSSKQVSTAPKPPSCAHPVLSSCVPSPSSYLRCRRGQYPGHG